VTWDDVIALALGGMKLTPAVFWRLSMREWLLLQRGYFNEMENEYKLRWEMVRWQTRIIAAPNYKPGFESILRLPWDAPPENPVFTDEEEAEFVRRMGSKIIDGKFVN
jgi:hypothetical protein